MQQQMSPAHLLGLLGLMLRMCQCVLLLQIILEGEMDVMSTTEDVDEQRRHLKPDVLVAELVYQSYAHMDYVYDRSPRHAFDVVDALYRFAPGTY